MRNMLTYKVKQSCGMSYVIGIEILLSQVDLESLY
jgi:hypothetical protein